MPYRHDASAAPVVAVAQPLDVRYRIAPRWAGQVWRFSSVLMVVALTALTLVATAVGVAPTIAVAWGLGVFVAIAWLMYQRRIIRTLTQRQNEAVQRLARGDVDGAAAQLDALALQSRAVPALHVLVVANRGVVALRRGDAAQAIALMTPPLASSWATSPTLRNAFPGLAASLALAHAYAGDLAAATRWQDAARAKLTAAQAGVLALGDAVLALRRGHASEATAVLASQWSNAEAIVGARQMRLLRIVRAFSLGEGAAHADEVRSLLEGARPSVPGEFDYIAGQWPELQSFLARHGFTRGLPAPTGG